MAAYPTEMVSIPELATISDIEGHTFDFIIIGKLTLQSIVHQNSRDVRMQAVE